MTPNQQTLLILAIIIAALASMAKWTPAQVWHLLVAMLAGFLLSYTSLNGTIRSLITTVSGGRI